MAAVVTRIRTLLSAGLLDLAGQADADQAVVRLKLLHGLWGVVDEGEASGLATTELGAQTEDGDLVLASLVHAGQLVAELILGDVGAVGVQDVTVMGKKGGSACHPQRIGARLRGAWWVGAASRFEVRVVGFVSGWLSQFFARPSSRVLNCALVPTIFSCGVLHRPPYRQVSEIAIVT